MASGKRSSVYLTDDLAEAVEASGLTLAAILRRGLGLDPVASPLGIEVVADARMPAGTAVLVAADHDGKPQVAVIRNVGRPRRGPCEHRVAADAYCKRCATA